MPLITTTALDHAKDEVQRTFHTTSSAYVLPNDNVEHQRLELQHQLQRQMMEGKLFHAPLSSHRTRKMLDIGCGTGAVTHEMAYTFPGAQIHGIDLSTVPIVRPKLSNISYIQGNFMDLAKSRFPSNSFDYVFSRLLILGMTHWKQYIARCVSIAKPGAWIEMHDLDHQVQQVPSPLSSLELLRPHSLSIAQIAQRSHPTDAYYHPAPWTWSTTLGKLLAVSGADAHCGRNIAALFEEVGLVDIRVRRYMLPYGRWDDLTVEEKRMADYVETFLRNVLPVCVRRAGEGLGDEWEGEVEEAVEELKRHSAAYEGGRYFMWMYAVCGKKVE